MSRPARPRVDPHVAGHSATRTRQPVYHRNVRLGLTFLAAVAVFSIAYGVFWFVVASQIRDGATEWVAARRAEGLVVGHSGFRVGGFPFLLRLTVEEPRLAAPGDQPSWAWEGQRAVVEMRPWSPQRVVIRLSGSHRLTMPAAGGPATYRGSAEGIIADLVLADGRPTAGGLSISGLVLDGENGRGRIAVGGIDFEARSTPAVDADPRTVTFEARLEATAVRVPDGLALPLGPRIDKLVVEAAVMGRVGAGPWPGSLAAWRDAGGTLEVSGLHVVYGPLDLWANGTLALDGELQPIGAFTAKVEGFFETVDALRERGLVRLRDAVTAKIVLGALSRKSAQGGPPTLNLALTVQDRKVYAGPVALADLPEIRWDGSGNSGPSPDR